MGIGTTMKRIISNDSEAEQGRQTTTSHSSSGLHSTNRLPAGTGPGTSGKLDSTRVDPAPSETRQAERPSGRDQVNPQTGSRTSQLAMEHDAQRTSEQGGSIEGYGTDAAAAVGGSLSGSHQGGGLSSSGGIKHRPTASKPSSGEGLGTTTMPSTTQQPVLESVTETTELPSASSGNVEGNSGRTETIPGDHQAGHNRNNDKDAMPTPDAQEDTSQLKPIMHERVRHLEKEEVTRVKEHERHIHHIQHHTQPVIALEELPEQHRDNVAPITVISGTHANKPEDTALFESQVHQFNDTLTHGAKERTVIDKGVVVTEHVHHHVHHIIQPVIEKETIERNVIHTTIPIHEITQEAPVVHQSQTHAPVPIEHFLSRGGAMEGAISQSEIGRKVLQTGQCARKVDGIAEKLEKELNLKPDSHAHGQQIGSEEMNRPLVAPIGRN